MAASMRKFMKLLPWQVRWRMRWLLFARLGLYETTIAANRSQARSLRSIGKHHDALAFDARADEAEQAIVKALDAMSAVLAQTLNVEAAMSYLDEEE